MQSLDRILVTGAAGFVGSTLTKQLLKNKESFVVGLDVFAKRREPSAIDRNVGHPRFQFLIGDTSDRDLIGRVLREYNVSTVVNCAAESSIDRSIGDPLSFVEHNVIGAARLLDGVAEYWERLRPADRRAFRFVQSSTIDVYGSSDENAPFNERSACAPSSPYAASMAAVDMVSQAYFRTYGLPTIIARSSTNYGPCQAVERLIPRTTYNALNLREQLVYGDGQNSRDWIHVDDQCRGIQRIIEHGDPGRTYNLSTGTARSNLVVVTAICRIVDELRPSSVARESLINFVDDRPGHDRYHAVDPEETLRSLEWSPQIRFETGLRQVVRWHVQQAERQRHDAAHVPVGSGDYIAGVSTSSLIS